MDSTRKTELDKLISCAIAIEEEEAIRSGTLGYMARMLVQLTMPHSDQGTSYFKRTNGHLSLSMLGHPDIGLPYGVYPRLLLAWLVTEAVRTKSPELVLGSNLSGFMSQLSLIPTGGRWGSIWRLRDQMKRLFSASVSCSYQSDEFSAGLGFNIAKEYQLWWDPKKPEQADIWQSGVTLGRDFFDEIVDRPVPIDMRVLSAVKGSAMAIDLYCWLTYRFSYLRKRTEIPWPLLQRQFGANYADTKQGRYEFKRKLKKQLKKVLLLYTEAKIDEGQHGLILSPSLTHIKKIPKYT